MRGEDKRSGLEWVDIVNDAELKIGSKEVVGIEK